MKKAGYTLVLIIFLVIIVIPGIVVKSCRHNYPKLRHDELKTDDKKTENTIAVYINSKKKIEHIPIEEYVKGVVAAEMPASFDMEALKAQAVAARTYVYRRLDKYNGSGCSLHPGADICDDPSHCQAWMTKGEMLKKWGIFSYYHYYSKINQATNSTAGMAIFYENEPIDPLFFSTSNGKTENSEDVWQKHVPYLRSVTSPGEETSPKFLEIKQIPINDIVEKLRDKWPDLVIDPKNPEKSWEILERSSGGRVKTMKVGNKTIRGTEFRMLFGLNSTDFEWERAGKNIKFICTGFGHGVGMSQYGANSMAKNGANYIDIIKHYYSGVEVKKSD